jgi:STE24 endopeptidase
LPLAPLYTAFGLDGPTPYGALVVFSLWFGPIGFLLAPLGNFLSRRNELAADAFAVTQQGDANALGSALRKLRERSHALPLSHPLFSRIYHSHPPLLERLAALRVTPPVTQTEA